MRTGMRDALKPVWMRRPLTAVLSLNGRTVKWPVMSGGSLNDGRGFACCRQARRAEESRSVASSGARMRYRHSL